MAGYTHLWPDKATHNENTNTNPRKAYAAIRDRTCFLVWAQKSTFKANWICQSSEGLLLGSKRNYGFLSPPKIRQTLLSGIATVRMNSALTNFLPV